MAINRFCFVLVFLFHMGLAFGAQVKDVKILEVKANPQGIKFTLQPKEGPKDSYFYFEVIKSDPDAFEKLSHIVRKAFQADAYRLDLNIPSFSISPSGSSYRSPGIQVTGSPVKN